MKRMSVVAAVLAVVLVAPVGGFFALTPAQQATLAADIGAATDAVPNIPGCLAWVGQQVNAVTNNSDGNFCVAAVYNLTASPNFTVWRTNVSTAEVKQAIVWTEYIAATNQAERDALNLIIADGTVNTADTNIQQGFQDIFSGPTKAVTRANLIALAKRLATRAEKLFATGTGSDVSPATMTFEGSLTFQDVQDARN